MGVPSNYFELAACGIIACFQRDRWVVSFHPVVWCCGLGIFLWICFVVGCIWVFICCAWYCFFWFMMMFHWVIVANVSYHRGRRRWESNLDVYIIMFWFFPVPWFGWFCHTIVFYWIIREVGGSEGKFMYYSLFWRIASIWLILFK